MPPDPPASGPPPSASGASSPRISRRSSAAGQDSEPSNSQELPRIPAIERQKRPNSLRPTRTGDYVGSYRIASPSRPEFQSPKKPGIGRRTSSRLMPHRGTTFSVDDASQEVEEIVERPPRPTAAALRRATSTLRRRTTAPSSLVLAQTVEADEDTEPEQTTSGATQFVEEPPRSSGEEGTTQVEEEDEIMEDNDDNDEDEDDLSDAESFTLKDRQDAINETHPFGIRIWKPALYRKNRSVNEGAEGDIHSTPGGQVSRWLWFFNFAWTVVFGWWLALGATAGALVCYCLFFAPGCSDYGHVLWGLAHYLFYPFGKYIKLIQDDDYAEEDEGEGRSISEYEQWQSGALEEGRLFFGPAPLVGRTRSDDDLDDQDETSSLLGRTTARRRMSHRLSTSGVRPKRRLFGRGHWNVGRVLFFLIFWGFLTPLFLLVATFCWLLVFTLPMARVMAILWDQLRRRPLTIEFHADSTFTRGPDSTPASILLCTYRATGTRYWKYTIDGTNIILFNLLGIVAFVIFDYWVLREALDLHIALTNTIFIFLLSLFSVIPLAYFIGQAVASISAQSTMGVGAAINAFFSTLVEVFLYCVALREGKAQLVEGSLIGSIFAGILLLPGISMCFGAIKRKTQRFNVKSAGVTTTMLLFATIAAFGPTLFYQIYGAHELTCHQCEGSHHEPRGERDCRQCFFTQIPAIYDPFYIDAVRPYTWFAAVMLFLAYMIGLLFTLRTHAATIWNTDVEEKKMEKMEQVAQRVTSHAIGSKMNSIDYGGTNMQHTLSRMNTAGSIARVDIKDSQLYKRILGQSLKQAGLGPAVDFSVPKKDDISGTTESMTSPIKKTSSGLETMDSNNSPQRRTQSMSVMGLSPEESQNMVRTMAEMAATAATFAARDATSAPRRTSALSKTGSRTASLHGDIPHHNPSAPHPSHTGGTTAQDAEITALEPAVANAHAASPSGGHDAPNWGRSKSYAVLLSATVAYAVIAEILVSTVDSVLAHSDIDEKFLGITLFALVPNTTEFLNAISFAMNGNIALSMEIGSAYALQVCLLQIPALVLFSALDAVWEPLVDPAQSINHTFTLIFPQWDMVTVILCVFLLSYMYGEGKSNYFKGSILILAYLVVIVGFYVSGMAGGLVNGPTGPNGSMAVGAYSQVVRGARRPASWVEY